MCIEAVRKVVEENQQLDLGVPVEYVLEELEITISSNNGKFVNSFFTQFNGATTGGPESASILDIFGAVYIDLVAKNGGPIVPTDWKRYRIIRLISRKTWKAKILAVLRIILIRIFWRIKLNLQ